MSAPVPTAPRAGSLRAWLLACRPATLTAAAAPVLVGSSIAAQETPLALGPGLAVFTGAALLQIGSNFANDVFDFEKGADTAERLGPVRAVQAGLLSPTQMKTGMWIVFGLALLVGLYLTTVAGWPIIAIGVASILSAIAYTGGPYPLGYNGLGDLFVFLFFGFVAVCGTVFVLTGGVSSLALWGSIGLGALATNILVVNNLRDRHTDTRAGKRTLAVRWGRRGAELEYLLLVLTAFLAPLAAILLELAPLSLLLTWLVLPLAIRHYRQVKLREGRELNLSLVQTARLVFLYGLSWSLGLWLGQLPFSSHSL